MADEKPKRSPEDRRAKMYDKGAAKPVEKKAPAEAEPKKKPDGEGEADPMADFKAMAKRHEMERRDAHGAHKDNLRNIAKRHETEIAEMMDKMGGKGGADTDGAAAAASADGGAMGGDEE